MPLERVGTGKSAPWRGGAWGFPRQQNKASASQRAALVAGASTKPATTPVGATARSSLQP